MGYIFNMSIEKHLNYEDTFLRDVTVAFIAQLHNRVYWYNRWQNETRKIEIPFYYSMSGDDRFLLDSFVDDIPGNRIEQNYDVVPRGVVTMESTTIKSNEFTNPNVRISRVIEEDAELRRAVSKLRSLPLVIGYEIKIRVTSEIDLFKCQQAIWNLIYQYQYFYFEHNFIRVDASFRFPDEFQTKIAREIRMDTDVYMEHTFRLDVNTYYPLFGEIENIPPINKVQWQSNIWKLTGSGAENLDELKKNQYPPDSADRTTENRNDNIK